MGTPITECYLKGSNGIQTSRDHIVYGFTNSELVGLIEQFRADEKMIPDSKLRERYWPSKAVRDYAPGDTRGWKLPDARRMLRRDEGWLERFQPVSYRPFDMREIFFAKYMLDWPRLEIMNQMIQPNLSLCVGRAGHVVGGATWNLIFVSASLADMNLFYRGGNVNYPLYFYSEGPKRNLFEEEETNTPGGRRPNLAPEFIEDVSKRLKMNFITDGKGDRHATFGPEDVFDYMYAVFHSPTYRTRYAEFLKIDFPRLPLTSNPELFRSLCAFGSELVGLHLMEQHAPPVASFPVKGDNIIEVVRYTEPGQGADEGRVWINKEQYFDNVSPEIWNFHVGGYQVCQKWLKDRKGRKLTYDDLAHYQRIVSALAETIRLMSDVDAVIDEHGGFPLE
jgi:predicted helicase